MGIGLVRYGVIGEVARFKLTDPSSFSRGDQVFVQTNRGIQVGTLLQLLPHPTQGDSPELEILRRMDEEDQKSVCGLREEAKSSFALWETRIREWGLELELVDLEWTLDELYVVRSNANFSIVRSEANSSVVYSDANFSSGDQFPEQETIKKSKLILYVLSGRGPEATKLALYAAAYGWGSVEVQPITAEGLVVQEPQHSGCGCSTGGGGCHN